MLAEHYGKGPSCLKASAGRIGSVAPGIVLALLGGFLLTWACAFPIILCPPDLPIAKRVMYLCALPARAVLRQDSAELTQSCRRMPTGASPARQLANETKGVTR